MTETVKTEVQRTPDEAYGVTEMRFLCASQIVIRSTGEIVKITDKMKLVYIYMKNQFIGFSSREQQFYTDQRHIKAALDISRDTLSKVLAALKKLGIVETAGWQGNSESYTVHFFNDVADNLQVIHREWKGVPAWDHERANKNFKSKNQKPTNEEKNGDDESDQGNAEQRDGVSDVHSNQHDDVSANDTVSSNREIAPLSDLLYWQNQGKEGLEEYLTMWGKTSKEEQTLIKSHIRIIQNDGYKGTRSAANDDLSGADARYKQQQAQRAAAAKQATNTPQQQEDEQLEFDDNEAF